MGSAQSTLPQPHSPPLIFFITYGFNQNRSHLRTVLATLQISRAFDILCHREPLEHLHDTALSIGLIPWLSNHLYDRQATTIFKNQVFFHRIVD